MTTAVRRFVTVGDRQVHYRRAGSGPSVVLLHESPLSSRVLVPLLDELAANGFTAFALDTPGYGQSDPLELTAPTVADYAAATAAAIAALRIEECVLYGAHTGAQIAVEVARTRPELLTCVIAEGPPILTDEERGDLLAHYCPPHEPVWSGGHLLGCWTMRRDQAIFWPWFRRDREHRRDADMLPAEVLHEGVLDVLRAGPGYGLGYAAAYSYDCGAALQQLEVPAWVVVTEGIFLADQLERLPSLPDNVHIELLPEERPAALRRIRELAELHRPTAPAATPPLSLHIAGRITRDYATTRYGQLLVRRASETAGLPLVMLHGSPGSAAALEPLMLALAPKRPVVALDMLGHGESDPPPWTEAVLEDYAQVVVAALDRLGVTDFDLYGTETGAEIAIQVAIVASHRVRDLILAGVDLAPDDVRAQLLARSAPPIEPRDDGTHLLEAWSHLKDLASFSPPHDRSRDAIVWREPPTVAELHAAVVELLKGSATHHIATRVALSQATADSLTRVATRTLVVSALGEAPGDEHAGPGETLLRDGCSYVLPGPIGETAAVFDRFLRGDPLA